jgi:hypothetical protein
MAEVVESQDRQLGERRLPEASSKVLEKLSG